MLRRIMAMLAVAVLAPAGAARAQDAAQEPGATQSQETVPAGGAALLLVNEGDDGRYWQLDKAQAGRTPRFPVQVIQEGVAACVNIGFVIEPDGSTSQLRPLVVWMDRPSREAARAFVVAMENVIKRRRYQPGPENPGRQRGFSSASANFGLSRTGAAPDMWWSKECEIDDLGAFLRKRAGQRADAAAAAE
jgi:hypothetical protein